MEWPKALTCYESKGCAFPNKRSDYTAFRLGKIKTAPLHEHPASREVTLGLSQQTSAHRQQRVLCFRHAGQSGESKLAITRKM